MGDIKVGILVRVAPKDKQRYREAAARAGLSLEAWARERLQGAPLTNGRGETMGHVQSVQVAVRSRPTIGNVKQLRDKSGKRL